MGSRVEENVQNSVYCRVVDAEVIVHKRDQFTEAVSYGRYGGLNVLYGQRIEAQVSWRDVRTLDRPLNIRRNLRSCSDQECYCIL